jgi:hypothetical protein
MTHTAFYGDGEKTFALTHPWILELEKTTGHGIGALFKRLAKGEYAYHDVLETVRLGLIGGGTSPEAASNLIATYGVLRPVSETFTIAIRILTVAMLGPEEPTVEESDDLAAAIDDALGQVPA